MAYEEGHDFSGLYTFCQQAQSFDYFNSLTQDIKSTKTFRNQFLN